jgi:septal ring factor EnvC (AmiA/AmiB activator)
LREILTRQEESFASLQHELTQSTAERDRLRTALGARDGELANLQHELAESAEEVGSLRQEPIV